MIKLEVEIKDEEFHYSFQVGKNKGSCSMPLESDALVRFADLLRLCTEFESYTTRERDRELWVQAYLEKNKNGKE